MRKTIVSYLLFLVVVLFSRAIAQQIPQYSQWSAHQFALNPAHAGIKSCIDIHSLYRLQWVGFQGAPKSGFLTISAPIQTKRKKYLSSRHGLGMRFETDQIGQFNTNRLNVAYAAHFNFSRDTRLSLGVYGGIIQMGYDPTKSITISPDPAISKEASFVAPDASFGAWWNGKNYYIGLVMQNLIRYKWLDVGTDSRYRFHTSLNAGYRIGINDKVSLIPGILMKIPPRGPVAFDVQVMADFNNKLQFGLGYRNTDAVIFFAGFKLNQRFSLQYSFDLTLSALRNVSSNSHELSISFATCKPQNTNTSRCPLFE
jgi:type IX secretion system PorP/SprF family membrane protein